MMSAPPSEEKGSEKICVFCDRADNNEAVYGKLLSKLGLTAHYFCMLFASGLSQKGSSEKEGILGFLPDDIRKELRRSSRLKCSFCKKGGATIGCVVRNCKKMFHLGCGRENHTLHQFFDTFRSYCSCHRPTQAVPSDPDPSLVCSICMNTVQGQVSVDTLRAPCCRKYWYHRDCIQRYASSAGLYFFKCPLCNNKEEFQNEMLQYGIYIPDQDASWETEPHAFEELLERYDKCDAKTCKCAEGRKHDVENTKWEIILCDFCGSSGSHVACGHLVKLGKRNVCPECFELDKKLKVSEPAYKTPPRKGSPKMPVLDPVTSPESPKGTSPYPGPSGSLKKNKLAGKVKSPAALSPVPKTSPVCQSAKQPKRRYRKRCASPAFTSPPKLKKVCTGTGKAGETDAAGGDINVTSSTAEQSSSPSSSEGEIPLAWMKIEEERKQNKMKKRKYKTKWSKTKSVKSVTNGQGLEAPALNADSTANSYMAEAETSTQLALEAKISQKDSTPGNGILSSTKQKRKQMSLGAPLVVSDKMFRPGPASKTKRKSLDEDKKQTLLTNWFTKVQQKNKETPPKTRAGVVKLKPNELKPTKPVLIEWKGKQLVILSPKVLLKRNEIFDKFKPRNLDIDMNDRKGCMDSNKEISMLASLESDVRLTRKRLDLGLQESGDWTEIEIPILSKPKSLEMDKTGSKGMFEKEVELLASLDIEKRITRKMLDSEMPTLTSLCHDQMEISPQKPKRKRKKHKVVIKKEPSIPEIDTLNEDKNSVDNKSIGSLENKTEKVLGKNVDLAQKNNRLIIPAETVYNAKEQVPKLKSLEKDKLSLNCGADSKRTAGSNFARKGLDGSTKTLSLPHTPPAKKSEQFVYPERSKSDSKKEAILLSQNISFALPKSFSFIHDSPAKNLRMRMTPEAIAQESSLELFNKTEVKIKTELTELEIKPLIEANRGIPNHGVVEPIAHKNKLMDISVRDSPSKNLRKRSHISYSEVSSPRVTKRQENMTGLPAKRIENGDQQKRTVQWYCEGTRQIDTVHFESENVCPNIQLSNHQNELHMLKMPLESSDQTKKCIPYSSVSLSPDSDNGDKSSDCKTAMNLSPSYFTKFRGTDSKALDNSGTSTSSEGEEIAGIENVPKEFSARRHIKALSDLHKSYMNSLSPDRFILDF